MKHSFRNVDFQRLSDFWNGMYPSRYRVDANLLRINTIQSPLFDWGASCVEEADGEILGFVMVKKSAASLYRVPDQDQVHLTAIGYCDANFGVDLLADLKELLRNRGASRLVFGQDSRHFFPGCPEDFHALSDFLMVEGFQGGGIANDLERDLADFANPYPIPDGDEMRVMTEDDVPSLRRFLEREFRYRWSYDVMQKVLVDGPQCVYGLFRDGNVEGFALIQDGSNQIPIGGAVWRLDLGDNWASLGPIGVSADLRGKGSGGALLGSALEHQKSLGLRRCIIDWTSLVDFYQKFGFEVSRRYVSLSLNL